MNRFLHTLVLAVFFLLLCTAAQGENAFDQTFQSGISAPVVLLDEEYVNRRDQSEKLSARITLKDADEDFLYLTIENRVSTDIRVFLRRCTVNGVMLKEYSEWIVPGNSTADVRLWLAENALRWMGAEQIETLAFEAIRVLKADDEYWEGIQIEKTDLSYEINPPTERPLQGYPLWKSELGQLTLLGVDYDNFLSPYLMLRLDNNQPNISPDWLPNYSQPQYMGVRISVASVNGRIPGRSQMEFSLPEMGSIIDHCAIKGFELDNPQPGEQNPVPVGEVKEITLQISVTADGMGNQPYEEVITLRMDELQLPQNGDPYDWIGNTGLTLRPEWEAYFESLRGQ